MNERSEFCVPFRDGAKVVGLSLLKDKYPTGNCICPSNEAPGLVEIYDDYGLLGYEPCLTENGDHLMPHLTLRQAEEVGRKIEQGIAVRLREARKRLPRVYI